MAKIKIRHGPGAGCTCWPARAVSAFWHAITSLCYEPKKSTYKYKYQCRPAYTTEVRQCPLGIHSGLGHRMTISPVAQQLRSKGLHRTSRATMRVCILVAVVLNLAAAQNCIGVEVSHSQTNIVSHLWLTFHTQQPCDPNVSCSLKSISELSTETS